MCGPSGAEQVAPGRTARYTGRMAPDRAERIRSLLETELSPVRLEVEDDSARHAGHAGMREGGARAGGQTHYNLLVVSPRFEGLNRVARHRLVNAALAPEFATGLHALSLVLRAPAEAG